MNIHLTLLPTLAFALFSFAACQGSRTTGVAPTETLRNGRSVSTVDPKYIDDSPTLSNDATKLIFISGRTDGVLRVYTATRTAVGTNFGTITRLSTNTGLTSEEFATISGDGSSILIQGATSTGKALVLCNFAGTTCTTVSTTPWEEAAFGFSPDSLLFFYMNGTSSAGATLSVATTAAPTANTNVGTADHWLHAFWMPNTGTYTLIAAEQATTVGNANLQAYTFASAGAASAATASAIVTQISYGSLIDAGPRKATGTASRFLIAKWLKPSADLTMSELGNVTPDTSKKKIPLRSQIHTYTASGTDEGALVTTGFDMIAGYVASDDDSIFLLNRIAGRCNGEGDLTYGAAFAIVKKSTSTVTWNILKKPTDLTQPPVVTTDFCDRTVNGTSVGLDLGPRYFSLNANATATAYTMAWVSDMTGDPEVFAMDLASGTQTLWNVSANKIP